MRKRNQGVQGMWAAQTGKEGWNDKEGHGQVSRVLKGDDGGRSVET